MHISVHNSSGTGSRVRYLRAVSQSGISEERYLSENLRNVFQNSILEWNLVGIWWAETRANKAREEALALTNVFDTCVYALCLCLISMPYIRALCRDAGEQGARGGAGVD